MPCVLWCPRPTHCDAVLGTKGIRMRSISVGIGLGAAVSVFSACNFDWLHASIVLAFSLGSGADSVTVA